MVPLRLLPAVAFAILVSMTAFACQTEPSNRTDDGAESTVTPIAKVSADIALLAHRLVFAYMSDKPWGFFGATCETWIEDDYLWETSMSDMQPDGRIKITYQRNEDRIIGPEKLVFYVDIDSQEVAGDNKPDTDTGRLGVAEGCDQW
ncbi:MAG: hypothetical protein OXC83_01990 [Chloroflexi bacterium]|nr:hypothetical protein [Chloroflexota bacterium]